MTQSAVGRGPHHQTHHTSIYGPLQRQGCSTPPTDKHTTRIALVETPGRNDTCSCSPPPSRDARRRLRDVRTTSSGKVPTSHPGVAGRPPPTATAGQESLLRVSGVAAGRGSAAPGNAKTGVGKAKQRGGNKERERRVHGARQERRNTEVVRAKRSASRGIQTGWGKRSSGGRHTPTQSQHASQSIHNKHTSDHCKSAPTSQPRTPSD